MAAPLTAAAPARAAGAGHVGAAALSALFDNVGISDDANPAAADIDGTGHSFSAEDLAADGWSPGATVTLGGTPLRLPDAAAGSPDNVVADGQTVSVRGKGDALTFVVASTAGATGGTGTINYADGSTQTFSLANGDWYTGPTDTMAVRLPHWNTPAGTQGAAVKLTPDTVPLNPAKTVASVTLPAVSAAPGPSTAALHVFALGIRPSAGQWNGTWTAAADDGIVNGPWTARTLRMVEHSSAGGTRVRIRLDNAFNTAPVTVAHATIAVQSTGAAATAAPVTLTFQGNQSVTIPAGGQAVSDGADFTVPADTNLLVSLYLPGPVALAPFHSLGEQDMYSSADQAGDQTTDVSGFPVNNLFGFWTLLSGIDVASGGPDPGTVVAFGDSITDGVGSTYDGNDRWPNDLARRLLGQSQYPKMGVVDAGISGNRVVSDDFDGLPGTGTGGISALSRLQRDVLAVPGARTVIVFEGINDIKSGTSADAVISGLEQIAAECRAAGLRVLAGTITPFQGYSAYTAAYEAARQDVNGFIRANAGGLFDGVIDFDAVVRDPADPSAMLPAYDSGDHLHPGAAGYHAMANAIDLSTLG
jgi:lysophospholipase L1-like esterase